jgi:cytochrome b6-f complex iron-sulfur subunit
MLRRRFIQRLPAVAGGLAAGRSTTSLTACAGARYIVPEVRAGALLVSLHELDGGGAVFLQSPGMDRPVFVRRDAAGGAVALLASCTHQGCQPEPLADRLVCPCHGSEFDAVGRVLQGPAEHPLVRYEVTEEGGALIVWLERRLTS